MVRSRRNERGFSMMEVQVAVVLLTLISLASWSTINSTLSLMGSKKTWSSQKTARQWTVASGWTQAELEYAKQLGYGGACGVPPCTIWVRMSGGSVQVSVDVCVSWAASVAPFAFGPVLPQNFSQGRIVVTTDPNSPTDPYTGASYLQDIEVDIFSQAPSNCVTPSAPYMSAYTSVGIR